MSAFPLKADISQSLILGEFRTLRFSILLRHDMRQNSLLAFQQVGAIEK